MSKMEGIRTWKKLIIFFLFILYIFLLWTILCPQHFFVTRELEPWTSPNRIREHTDFAQSLFISFSTVFFFLSFTIEMEGKRFSIFSLTKFFSWQKNKLLNNKNQTNGSIKQMEDKMTKSSTRKMFTLLKILYSDVTPNFRCWIIEM